MAAPPEERQPISPKLLFLGMALMFAYLIITLSSVQTETRYSIPYSRFVSLLQQGEIQEVNLRGRQISGTLRSAMPIGPDKEQAQRFITVLPDFGNDRIMETMHSQGVTIQVLPDDESDWRRLLLVMLPWLVLLFFFYGLMRSSRRMGGGMGGPGELQQFLTKTTKEATIPKITFRDVAGQVNAKQEVRELVDYLRDPERFSKLGAEAPRGVLLMGPPGTGKTLLAKALAGEAGVPFYSISGSEFIEMFVGVGAARVRNLFQTAKKNAPSIIFVDELDSVGRTRGTGLGGGHDEREQTLNQILAEMDGFAGHEAVIVLAATNRPDVLDPALLRPGRFDRHVTLDLPDRNERIEVLKVHSRNVPLAPDVTLDNLAGTTPGFSGADLKNLVNEAAMLAGREKTNQVAMRHFEDARDKLLLGTVRTMAIQPDEHHRLAVHEAGHTLLAHFLPRTDPLYKVTIIPRGRALGATQQLATEEHHTLPEGYLRDRLALLMGGRVAEKELMGSVSSGADNDIRAATSLARAMVARWGMSPEIGPVDLRDSEEHPFLGREIAQPRRFSENSAQAVDDAVRDLIMEAENRARTIITENRQPLDRLIAALEEQETLDSADINNCLGQSV